MVSINDIDKMIEQEKEVLNKEEVVVEEVKEEVKEQPKQKPKNIAQKIVEKISNPVEKEDIVFVDKNCEVPYKLIRVQDGMQRKIVMKVL